MNVQLTLNLNLMNINPGVLNGVIVRQFFEVKNAIILQVSYKENERYFKARVSQIEMQKVINEGVEDWEKYRNDMISLAMNKLQSEVENWKEEINN